MRRTADFEITGSVAPMAAVGISSSPKARAKRAAAKADGLCSVHSASASHPVAASRWGNRKAKRPTPASRQANTSRGLRAPSIQRPEQKLPRARPAMKALSTVLTAGRVAPKTTISMRAHRTW